MAQRAVAFVAIVFLFLLACFALAAYAKMARPELRLTTLIGEYSERTINSPGGSRGFRIFDFDPTFRPAWAIRRIEFLWDNPLKAKLTDCAKQFIAVVFGVAGAFSGLPRELRWNIV